MKESLTPDKQAVILRDLFSNVSHDSWNEESRDRKHRELDDSVPGWRTNPLFVNGITEALNRLREVIRESKSDNGGLFRSVFQDFAKGARFSGPEAMSPFLSDLHEVLSVATYYLDREDYFLVDLKALIKSIIRNSRLNLFRRFRAWRRFVEAQEPSHCKSIVESYWRKQDEFLTAMSKTDRIKELQRLYRWVCSDCGVAMVESNSRNPEFRDADGRYHYLRAVCPRCQKREYHVFTPGGPSGDL